MTPPTSGRLVGSHEGASPGPLVLVVGAIHGNEPAGVAAASSVLGELAARHPPFRGRLVALVGNVGALEARVRYRDVDLNRAFTEERVAAVRSGSAPADAEAAEQRALLQAIDGLPPATVRHVLDLHTSSSHGAPFATLGDTLGNRAFQRRVPVPKVLGLEEQLDGSLLEHLSGEGFLTMGFEGGQHDDPASVLRHEAVIWLALAAAGCIDERDVPDVASRTRLLAESAPDVPRYVEVRYRHAIRPEDGFRMVPGYRTFQPVRRGEVLGHDRRGEVRATEDGMILLPLYQGSGDDGFFLGRALHPFWLSLSSLVRRSGAGALAPLLPGVRRDPHRPGTLLVDRSIARIYAVDLFHLLGYRKRRERGTTVVLERRLES